MRPRHLLLAALVVLSCAACGAGDDPRAADAAPTSTIPPPTAPPATRPPTAPSDAVPAAPRRWTGTLSHDAAHGCLLLTLDTAVVYELTDAPAPLPADGARVLVGGVVRAGAVSRCGDDVPVIAVVGALRTVD